MQLGRYVMRAVIIWINKWMGTLRRFTNTQKRWNRYKDMKGKMFACLLWSGVAVEPLIADRIGEVNGEQLPIKASILDCKVDAEAPLNLSKVKLKIRCTVSNDADSIIFISEPSCNIDTVITNISATTHGRGVIFGWVGGGKPDSLGERTYKFLDRDRFKQNGGKMRSQNSDRELKFLFSPSEVVPISYGEYTDDHKRFAFDENHSNYDTIIVEGYLRLIMIDPKNDRRIISKLPFSVNWKRSERGEIELNFK